MTFEIQHKTHACSNSRDRTSGRFSHTHENEKLCSSAPPAAHQQLALITSSCTPSCSKQLALITAAAPQQLALMKSSSTPSCPYHKKLHPNITSNCTPSSHFVGGGPPICLLGAALGGGGGGAFSQAPTGTSGSCFSQAALGCSSFSQAAASSMLSSAPTVLSC